MATRTGISTTGRHSSWCSRGRITIEFQETVQHYTVGETYVEPIGVIHRAHNPNPETPFLCVGFALTPPDREPVVNMKQPW